MSWEDDYLFKEARRIWKLDDADLETERDVLHTLVFNTPSASWLDVRLFEIVENEYVRRQNAGN